jgi:hypothetical protein
MLLLLGCTSAFDTGWGNACVLYVRGCGSRGTAAEVDGHTCYDACGEEGAKCAVGTCPEAWIDPCGGGRGARS